MKYQNPNFYFLSLGAYGANDAKQFHVFNSRVLKGAYLVPVEEYDCQEVIAKRNNDSIQIMWCARFVDWKHPELILGLAKQLLKNKYTKFHISMVGANSPLQDKIKNEIKKDGLEDVITVIDGLPNSECRRMMRSSDIFLVTSDRHEGWGAVVNEAMSESCAIVACDEVGSVPFLIKHRRNGMIFKARNVDSLFQNVRELIDNKELRLKIAENAYKTISEEWSPKVLCSRLIKFSESILSNNPVEFQNGPISKAYPCNKKLLIQ